MAEVKRRRAEMHRLDHEENKRYRGFLGFSIFVVVSIAFMMVTFMNPSFMKNQIAKDSNVGLINRAVNTRFNSFAQYVGADRENDENLLTSVQTIPIAEEIIDYSLGIHGFRTDTNDLARNIQSVLVEKVNDDSATEVKKIQKIIKTNRVASQYAISSGFNLRALMVMANGITVGFIAGPIIILLALIMIISIIKQLKRYFDRREIVNNFFGSSMWVGGIIMLVYGVIAIIPSFINTEQVFGRGFGLFLELGSSIFLELVIVGVALFVISIIPWAASKPK